MTLINGPWTEHPEFVQLYDVDNAGLWDTEFYCDLVLQLQARRVADIGCGTGVLAVELGQRGVEVTGVDPSQVMIDVGQQRVQQENVSDTVRLIRGTAAELATSRFDAAVMVGHVAQYFLRRTDWDEALAEAYRALAPGGYLAFESRNPDGAEWDAWDEDSTRETQPHPEGGEFTSWLEVADVQRDATDGDIITARGHHLMPDGRHLIADEPLRYRPQSVLTASLEQAGFEVSQVWGDWDLSPVEDDSPELIFLAHKL